MLGTRTRGGRMVGADESTELWRHPQSAVISLYRKNCTTQLGPFCVQILSSWRIIRYPKSRIKNLIYFMEPLITTSIVVLQHCSLNIYCTEEKSDMIFSHRLPPPPSMDLQFCLPLSCEISQKSFCKLT